MSRFRRHAALEQRIGTGLLLAVGTVTAALLLPSAAFGVALLAVVMLGAWEWARLTGLGRRESRLVYLALVAVCALGLWQLFDRGYPLVPIVLGVAWWLVALVALAVDQPGETRGRLKALWLRAAGLFTLVPAWIAAIALHRLNPQPDWLIFLLVLVWLADSAAFFTGRLLGKTQLAPVISPSKTREGVFGALVANGILAALGAWWFELPAVLWVYFIALCMITTLLSVAGDLFESLLKRHAGVKDSGTMLPGHGGILDRIDSAMAAAPPFVLGLHWMSATYH